MTLADSIAAALPGLRAEAESLMVDACTITRPGTGTGTVNETTGEVTPPAPTTVYAGKCRVQRPGASTSQNSTAGDYEIGVNTLLVQLPVTALGVKRGDDFTLTAVGPLTDADLLGSKAEVRANLAKTHATKRTLICEEAN